MYNFKIIIMRISIHSTTRVETKTSLKCPCNASISIHSTTRVETGVKT